MNLRSDLITDIILPSISMSIEGYSNQNRVNAFSISCVRVTSPLYFILDN